MTWRYSDYICAECGTAHGRRSSGPATTWHYGTCDVCGRPEMVTEPRDFGHLRDSWRTAANAGS